MNHKLTCGDFTGLALRRIPVVWFRLHLTSTAPIDTFLVTTIEEIR